MSLELLLAASDAAVEALLKADAILASGAETLPLEALAFNFFIKVDSDCVSSFEKS